MPHRGFYRSGLTTATTTEARAKATEPLAHSRQQAHLAAGHRVF